MSRLKLLLILATMPDEAFGWLLNALAHNIYPDGLGGFQNESRTAITEAVAEAKKLAGYEDAPPAKTSPRRPRAAKS